MKSVNGILLIVIAVFVLWIGATGRFPKLMEAVGILRGKKSDAVPQPNGVTPSIPPVNSATPNIADLNKSAQSFNSAVVKAQKSNVLAWPFLAGLSTFEQAYESFNK